MNPVSETNGDDTGGASAPASPAPINLGKDDAPTVLGKLRTLVQDKTRFEPQDITPLAEDDVLQDFSLQANYTFEARLEQRHINGYFTPSASDHCCASHEVTPFAQGQTKDRLRRAAARLGTELNGAGHAYDAIADGLYLGHAVKQWHLDTCHSCAGHAASIAPPATAAPRKPAGAATAGAPSAATPTAATAAARCRARIAAAAVSSPNR